MKIKHTSVLKALYFSLLLPTYLLTLEKKVCLNSYPRLAAILNDSDNSFPHISLINRYLDSSMNNTSPLFTYSNDQRSYITLGLYRFFTSKEPNQEESKHIQEQNQCIFEANNAFNIAFLYPHTWNINVNTSTNDTCNRLETALWWDYYLNKIPFVQSILNFIKGINKLNKLHEL
jgi:hypothetical protein